ncbi:hypothetical protein SZ64_14435 [Erythrobacter sp. SG61-1L]|uniref:hypothetical protein n=1 Tax=Erythrobacter sp. SG61-1L TaxID=1603897 RepID=UPI0006C92F91|nr:hypothetical protein [Erythrobacter sp. SG61-1L]KPL69192.1 hypothetical protein SZ64_14435 [Erythrobacter sp. SG61-1L]
MTDSPANSTDGAAQEEVQGEPAGPWRPRLWHIWLALSAFLLLINLHDVTRSLAPESDDYLRLAQVRDWLAGQDWFDSRQYRMNPPVGADIHWVRLVDLPIAGFILLFRLFLNQQAAETAAMVAVPLAQLYVTMLVLRALMRELGQTASEVQLGMLLIPLMPLLSFNYMPMRIDHHGWQATAMLTIVWLMIRTGYRQAFVAGFLAAVLLFISVEGMPMVAAIGGLYAVRYWLDRAREYEGYLLGLAIGGPVLFLVLRPLSDVATPYCDMLSWPHFLAFGASALAAAGARIMPAQGGKTGRLLALLPIPLVAAPAMLLPLGICAISPMSVLDPVLKANWFNYLMESAPLWRQIPSVAVMLVADFVLIALGVRLARERWRGTDYWQKWIFLTLATLAAAVVALLVMRAAITAQLLTLPFSALLLATLLPRAQALGGTVKRVIATVICFVLVTPALVTATAKPFDAKVSYTLVTHPKLGMDGECSIDRLREIPPSMMFASLDLSAQIVARTPHSVVMGGYHRNQAKMLEVFRAFGGPIDQAETLIRANHAKYVVTCTSSPDLAAYANMGEDNLADRIFAGNPPPWLEPVPNLGNAALRLYRVR